jgi:uracil DNA glycosylase
MAVSELRKNRMMEHLLDALEGGKDIGHYGRLVFVMVARHFLKEDELVRLLTQDPDVNEESARGLLQQVEERDYNPPSRERIMEWQAQQDFPILPDGDDPDAGNVYRDLEFPERIYEHISEYHQQKASHS